MRVAPSPSINTAKTPGEEAAVTRNIAPAAAAAAAAVLLPTPKDFLSLSFATAVRTVPRPERERSRGSEQDHPRVPSALAERQLHGSDDSKRCYFFFRFSAKLVRLCSRSNSAY